MFGYRGRAEGLHCLKIQIAVLDSWQDEVTRKDSPGMDKKCPFHSKKTTSRVWIFGLPAVHILHIVFHKALLMNDEGFYSNSSILLKIKPLILVVCVIPP